jgi:hypothetical protein
MEAADELQVPLHDDRMEGLLRARELCEGQLVHIPVSGSRNAISRKQR